MIFKKRAKRGELAVDRLRRILFLLHMSQPTAYKPGIDLCKTGITKALCKIFEEGPDIMLVGSQRVRRIPLLKFQVVEEPLNMVGCGFCHLIAKDMNKKR